MKSGGRKLACLLGGMGLCILARGATEPAVNDSAAADSAVAPVKPYEEIVTRNVFGLKPPPPPPSTEDPKPPPSKITLTGIWTVTGKLAMMKTPAPPPKQGEQAKGERFYTLHVGERDGDIEVRAIDEKAGSVTVLNAGQEEVLTFEKNGVKLAATPPPAIPGAPGTFPGVPPPGGGMVVPPPMKAGDPGVPAFPSRMIRSPTPGSPQAGTATPGYGMVAPAYGTTTAQQPRAPVLTPEQATVVMEVERQRLLDKGSPNALIMPPTGLSRETTLPPGATPGGLPGLPK